MATDRNAFEFWAFRSPTGVISKMFCGPGESPVHNRVDELSELAEHSRLMVVGPWGKYNA